MSVKKAEPWPDYILKPLSLLRPPERLTVSQWAERDRILDSRSSAMPGRWSNAVTPYLVDIMDEMNNPDTTEIVFVKPTQVGGTEAIFNMLGWCITCDPAGALMMYPSDRLGERVSENRLQPMLRLSPSLRSRFRDMQSQRLELQCEGMSIAITGSGSPANISSFPMRYVFMDEVDKYDDPSSKESDPISLARERTKTFTNKKIVMTSTPTLRTGNIWRAMEAAEMLKHYFVPCPNCGELIELVFAQIKFSQDKDKSIADRAESAVYKCQACEGTIPDSKKPAMLRNGCWKAVRQNTAIPTTVAYWLNTLYSPFVTWAQIAKEWLSAQGDTEKLQNFINSWLAEAWENTILKTDADTVLSRQTDIPELVVPDWAEMLTGGVDVQHNCLYWTIRAWGPHQTSQNIAHGQVLSFSDIERVMNMEYKKADGACYLVELVGVDSGDQTDMVYEFCLANAEWAIPVKGTPQADNHYTITTIDRADSNAHGTRLVRVDGGKYKDIIASRMRRVNGVGSWMVYQGCDRSYAEQMTAEHKVLSKDRKKSVWEPRTTHAANHYLDAEVYAYAAADVMQVRLLGMEPEEEPEPLLQQETEPKASPDGWLSNNQDWLGGGSYGW